MLSISPGSQRRRSVIALATLCVLDGGALADEPRAELKVDGVLLPAAATVFYYLPREHSGESVVREVAAHGGRVRAGDILFHLDPEGIDERIRDSRWSLRNAEIQLDGLRRKQEHQAADASDAVRRADRQLAWAEKELRTHQESLARASRDENAVEEQSFHHQLADQEDELKQLETMYKEDDLTEETEEIVLKRARRDIKTLRQRLDIYLRRAKARDEVAEPRAEERLRDAFEAQSRELRDLRLTLERDSRQAAVEIEKASHAAAKSRLLLERLEEDRKLFDVRSPHDGLVIHGDVSEEASVRVLKAGDKIQAAAAILTLAREGSFKARFSVDPRNRTRLAGAVQVQVAPAGLDGVRIRAALDPLPRLPGSDGSWVGTATFRVEDERIVPLLKCEVSTTGDGKTVAALRDAR